MRVHEWEVWHSYTAALAHPIHDLRRAARLLVESDLVPAAYCSDGTAVWKDESGVRSGEVDVELETGGRTAQIALPSGVDGYAKEGLFQAADFRFAELRLFGQDAALPSPYVRALMGECVFLFANHGDESENAPSLAVYPMLKVYESGVASISLRVIGPDEPTDLEVFVRDAVMAFLRPFDLVAVPPGLARLAPRATAPEQWQGLRNRWRTRRAGDHHDAAIEQLTVRGRSGDFDAALAPLTIPTESSEPETVRTLALTILAAVGYVLGEASVARWRLPFTSAPPNELVGPWVGRRHVYVIRHDDQRETASENERAHADEFGEILLGRTGCGPGIGQKHLPPSARQFEDFGIYLNGPASLWVYSESGRRWGAESPWAIGNHGHFVYEHHVKTELLDYGDMIHRRLAFEAQRPGHSVDETLRLQNDILSLEDAMAESGHFGEVRDLCEAGWAAMGVPQLRNRVRQRLELRQQEASVREARRATRWATLLTIVFGLVAVPALATDVLPAFWRVLRWPSAANQDLATVQYTAAAVGVVIGVLGFAALLDAWVHQRSDR